ncbi:MAG TPA: PAS domain S-box protein [Verrucomicrobiota bacterium]|nr:PAS domain S-box protein [Verrucomicrobiota bacterium]
MNRLFPDSFFSRDMKDYRKMSKAQLLAWIGKLKSSHASQTRAHKAASKAQRAIAKSELRDREARLRAILETAVEGIITINDRGIIESFNAASEKIFGYKAREVIGRNVSVLMPSPHRENHDEYIQRYNRTGHAKIIGIGREVSGRRKDGTIFPMDLSVSEVQLAGRKIFTGFVRDITDRKRLEKEILEITDRERRRFGYDLHDGLCQHLAGIELKTQVLEQKLEPASKEAAERVGEIGKHVREAIGHTRLLARGLSPVTLEADGLMSALKELSAGTAKIFSVGCRFDCPRRVLVADQSTATNLYRIAQEAVSNAIKHGRATRIIITLENSNGRVQLRVRDNGSGFATDTPHAKGMGLRIMQSRAGMIGGNIALERNAAGGVTVACSAPNPSPKKKSKANARQG